MELYHASPTAGLTVLRPSRTEFFGKPKQVCLTSLKPMALLYGIKIGRASCRERVSWDV